MENLCFGELGSRGPTGSLILYNFQWATSPEEVESSCLSNSGVMSFLKHQKSFCRCFLFFFFLIKTPVLLPLRTHKLGDSTPTVMSRLSVWVVFIITPTCILRSSIDQSHPWYKHLCSSLRPRWLVVMFLFRLKNSTSLPPVFCVLCFFVFSPSVFLPAPCSL